jgi:hypothetical protein
MLNIITPEYFIVGVNKYNIKNTFTYQDMDSFIILSLINSYKRV